ncbi:hypothetical protein ILUMI_23257 [Ignelater luminosus]|uniref:Uncharacterized protein n=1 Tax=Ignelater luminosus TaxID=2038154 RepID=A0A8K0CEZ7_IGNLU|nr:hypothetical protein ILUMI_23257 [Ignelater luminosus]
MASWVVGAFKGIEQRAGAFQSFEKVLTLYNFGSENVCNVDESGFSTVQTKPDKIYATKGRKQVGVSSSAKRGQYYTVVCCNERSRPQAHLGVLDKAKEHGSQPLDTGFFGPLQAYYNQQISLWLSPDFS